MNKNFKLCRFIFFAVFFISVFPAFSKIRFDDLDLSNEDFLIFSAHHTIPGTPSYKTLFYTQLDEQKIKMNPVILTCFPEKLELLNEGRTLQVRNRYGTAEYSVSENNLKWTSLSQNIPADYTHTGAVSVSPDGKYFCYVKQSGNTKGVLVIADSATKEEVVLVDNASFSYESVNVKWAPDSKALLYEKDKNIFFITPSEAFKKINLPESYRKIGSGSINSVQWTMQESIIYIDDDIIYKIEENELYTRGLYSVLIGSGRIIGSLPNSFDSIRDKFWTNIDGTKIAVISRDNIAAVYSAASGADEFSFVNTDNVFPLVEFNGSAYNFEIFWGLDSSPVLWVDTLSFDNAEKISYAYSVKDSLELIFEAKNSIAPCLSPDRRKVAYTDSGKFCIYDISAGKQILSKENENIVSVAWSGNSLVYTGGEETVKLMNMNGDEKFLFLSSACNPSWNGGRIVCRTDSDKKTFIYDSEKNIWKTFITSVEERKHSEKNGRYRVFLGASLNPKFENAVYVRSLSGKVITYSACKETDLNPGNPKKAVLVFDAVDNADGLSRILYTLDLFGIRGTFFLNGEFIRRYPHKTKQIASSGNECASMFFTSADLIENNFMIDKDFIRRGLARNEDEFFTATGKELSLFWHAPYYHSNKLIKTAGNEAGYEYIEAFNKFNDTVSFEKSRELSILYRDSGNLIDSFVDSLYDGIIIPVSVGKPDGTRSDYLYEKLDMLIAAILDNGYEIVTLRDLK